MTKDERDLDPLKKRQDERLGALVEHSFDAITLVSPDGTVEYGSPAIGVILGYTPTEFVGRNGFEHIHPEDLEEVRGRFAEVLRHPGDSVVIDTRLRHKDGSWRWVESRVTNLLENPAVQAVVSNFRDITERKLVEEELRRKQEELTDFIENATLSLHWVGPDGTILWANQAELTMLGYRREEYIGRNIAEFHADPFVIADILRSLAEKEELHSYEARLRCKDGSIRHVLISSNVLWQDGKFVHTRCFTRDITERKRLEAEFLRQREFWRVALASIGDAVIVTDGQGQITFMNPVAESLCGWREADALGKPLAGVFSIVNEKTRIPLVNPVERVFREGHVVGLANHTVLITPDERETPIDDSAAPIVNDQGRITGVALVFRDVTAPRKAQELNERLAAIVESSDDIIISKTLDGIITSWNRGAERTLGYSAEEIIGKHVSMLMPAEHAEDVTKILRHIRRGKRVGHYETQRVTKDGRIIDVSLSVSPIRDADGQIIGAAKVARDITDRKQAEEERKRLFAAAEAANRMKDDFLATLSHELRTPLNAIVGWAKILRSGKVDAEDLQEGFAAIDRNSRAQAQIIEDLLDISRIIAGKLRLEVQRLNLTDIIETALAAVLPAANAKELRIHKVLDSLAGPVTGDTARLQQVIWNLLTNAVKFTPKGGQVQVLLERVNSHVEISVIDTGIGIKPEFLPHVFDRFRQADASTTRRHAGLGLGLAIVKQLIEMHGGSIRAKSPGEGQGATFTVTLPIIVIHPERPESPKVRPKEDDATEDVCQDGALAGLKVLVVDDEPDARQLIRRVLADCEAEVAVASSAAEALAMLGQFRPDVIVSDIGMPEQDGYDLIRVVRADPATKDIPAAALTAFARTEDRKRSLLAGFQTHVAKPVDPAELTAAVASLTFRTGKRDQHQGGQP